MTLIDFTQLGQPPIVLTLEEVPGGYTVTDQDGNPYVLSPSPLDFCIRFMRAMAIKNQAVLDEDSITWFRLLRAQDQHSLRVPSMKDVWPDDLLPTNVIPLRRDDVA